MSVPDRSGSHFHCPSCGYEEPGVVEWERTYVAVDALLSDEGIMAAEGALKNWEGLPEEQARSALEAAIRAVSTQGASGGPLPDLVEQFGGLDQGLTTCALCGQEEGHSKRCSVTKFGVEEMRAPPLTGNEATP